MINEEIKFALSHLEEDKIQKIKDNTRIFIENTNRIAEDPDLTLEQEDELDEIATPMPKRKYWKSYSDPYTHISYHNMQTVIITGTMRNYLSRTFTNIISNERLPPIPNYNYPSQRMCHYTLWVGYKTSNK